MKSKSLKSKKNYKIEEIEEIEEMRSLIDGAYDIIYIWKAESPAQIEWHKNWLKKAKKYGAGLEP